MKEFNSERREYYRINDVIGLVYTRLDKEQPPSTSTVDNLGVPVKNLLSEIDREFNQAANILWHENPTIAHAFGLLNKKLSIIASQVLGDESENIESYEQLMVNLSGCGIAFDCLEKIPVGTPLLLSLMLKPSNSIIELQGKVIHFQIRRRPGTRKPYFIRVHFDGTNPISQEQLIQHIVQKQCAQIGYRFPEATDEEDLETP